MYDKYQIRSGDSIKGIAKKFNTSVATILDINNIAYPDMLRVGMEIIVPKDKENYFEYYTIGKGDTLYQISRQYNINPELLAVLNGMNLNDYIYPGQEILIPKNGYSYYITDEGDTLELVANKFNVSKSKVLNDNETIYLMAGQLMINKKMWVIHIFFMLDCGIINKE